MKTVEQRLFEAFVQGRGVRLTSEEVHDLIAPDDAIGTRITNVACAEAGIEEYGCDSVSRSGKHQTWEQFKKSLTEG